MKVCIEGVGDVWGGVAEEFTEDRSTTATVVTLLPPDNLGIWVLFRDCTLSGGLGLGPRLAFEVVEAIDEFRLSVDDVVLEFMAELLDP